MKSFVHLIHNNPHLPLLDRAADNLARVSSLDQQVAKFDFHPELFADNLRCFPRSLVGGRNYHFRSALLFWEFFGGDFGLNVPLRAQAAFRPLPDAFDIQLAFPVPNEVD